MCCNVTNVWPKTTLLPVWRRDTKRLDAPATVLAVGYTLVDLIHQMNPVRGL